jgi:hypothetical protein
MSGDIDFYAMGNKIFGHRKLNQSITIIDKFLEMMIQNAVQTSSLRWSSRKWRELEERDNLP